MYPYDENENRNENVPGEENAAEENVNENAANPDAGAAEASAGCDNAAEEPDGSYRMVKPDAGKSFDAKQRPCYRDANYTSEGAANFYSPSNGRKEKEAKPKKVRRGMPAAAVVALCLACALVGGGAGGVIAQSFAGEASPAPTTALTQEPAPTSPGSTVSSESGGVMSASDIYYKPGAQAGRRHQHRNRHHQPLGHARPGQRERQRLRHKRGRLHPHELPRHRGRLRRRLRHKRHVLRRERLRYDRVHRRGHRLRPQQRRRRHQD